MDEKSLKEKVALAKAAVETLEEPLKTKAFEILLQKLLSGYEQPLSNPMNSSKNFEEDVADRLMNQIDSTRYPSIFKITKTLNVALYLLYLAKNDHNTDGLTPPQISKILSLKFRLPCSASSISMALMKAPTLADRKQVTTQGAVAYEYKITHPGGKYVENLLKNPPSESVFPSQRTLVKTRPVKNNKKKSKGGLKEKIIQLKNEKFFEKPKIATEVASELKDRGFPYNRVPITVALLRLVRNGMLKRIKEVKGQKSIYAYCNL